MRLALATIILLVGCASTSNGTPPPAPVDKQQYNPPVEIELTLSDRVRREHEAILNEENAYNASLQKIDDKMTHEHLDYYMCIAVSEKPNKEDCKEKLKAYCKEAMMIDTRRGHHEKPYCKDLTGASTRVSVSAD
jgi:hypothetical protein